MSDVHDLSTVPPSDSPEEAQAEAAPKPPAQRLTVEFTASGRDYLWLWLVNTVLTVLSLGLYWPFARTRRQAYFYAHTRVGADALSFDGDPWTLFQTHLLLLGLATLYGMVYLFMPQLSWLPALLLALLGPALWHSALVFRLRHTRWRGERLGFAGSLQDAYGILLPLCLMPLWVVGLGAMNAIPSWDDLTQTELLWGPVGITLAGMFLAFPWLMAQLHSFKNSGCMFKSERTQLGQSKVQWSLYLLYFKMLGITLALIAAFTALAALSVAAGMEESLAGWMLAPYLVLPLVLGPYFKARAQNLLWHGTGNSHFGIQSHLRFRDMFKLSLQNGLLIALTLGLFWPFAVVRSTRLRLSAMAVQVLDGPPPAQVQASPSPSELATEAPSSAADEISDAKLAL